MKTQLIATFLLLALALTLTACEDANDSKETANTATEADTAAKATETPAAAADESWSVEKPCTSLHKHIPAGYKIYESDNDILGEAYGDLNEDGINDCVLLIRATDESKIDSDDHLAPDKNRLGIMIFFNSENGYQLALENRQCIPPPEYGYQILHVYSADIKKGNLYISEHGRYNGKKYTFRHKNSDFELIGFDSYENIAMSPIIQKEVSINFLSKKRLVKTLENEDAESEEKAVYKETWDNIKADETAKLSKIVSLPEQ
jgi:hypothetical protein